VYNGSGDGTGSFEVEIWSNAAKLTDIISEGFRESRDLISERKVFVKDETEIAG